MNQLTVNPARKKPAAEPAKASLEDGLVSGQTSLGLAVRGKLIKLNRLAVAFEVYDPAAVLRLSETLDDLKIFLDDRQVYAGRGVICNLFHTAALIVCEVKLDEPGVYVGVNLPNNGSISFLDAYQAFFGKWQNQTIVLPAFKMAVLDLEGYLSDLKLLLEQVEISFAPSAAPSRAEMEAKVFKDLSPVILGSVDAMREKLLAVAAEIEPDLYAAHQVFLQRHLHPLFLCAPFGNRTFYKPLGYPGDYEMMNMIYRNGFEGGSLYARMVHHWLVNQAPSISVRNRVAHMKDKLVAETLRGLRKNRTVRILNLGCGAAREVQEFIAENDFADRVDFTLLDFDAETLNYAKSKIEAVKLRHNRRTKVQYVRISATQLIKESAAPADHFFGGDFDLIYSGGLFDYLSDRVCKQIVGLFYDSLTPGGLVMVANMADKVPFRHMMEFLLDWHLLYRDSKNMATFVPENAPPDSWAVVAEAAAVNLFLEVRKPSDD
jgi:extracellular factor (EF) 3-hydroxypalmitic acid methyl ester biosynthesis protein